MSTSLTSGIEPASMHPMEICSSCIELVQAISSRDDSGLNHSLERRSGSTCWFCEVLTQRLIPKTMSKQSSTESSSWDISLQYSDGLMDDEDDLRCRTLITLGDTSLLLAVWADEGTPASRRFVIRPPILGPNTEQSHSHVRGWLTHCISFHGDCESPFGGALPTRVLQISTDISDIKSPAVKLLETGGMSAAKYCALSHCWGPVNKQPLRTTRTSYACHLHGISYDQLPKSFKDAIMLTLSLSIEYIWIDSLCIIQDNEQDWLSEASKMAEVYRNATLVISASGAKDSTEGLFITERKHTRIMTVPYIAESMAKGTFNIALLPHTFLPSGSHLNSRAWAFQERYLARRIVFFAREGIAWSCGKYQIKERDDHPTIDLGFHEGLSWLCLLALYSEKRLTYARDRLYALQGVIEDMRKTREDEYYEDYGVWGRDLYSQLIWKQDEPLLEAEVLDLPTWTWAATGGAKVWCLELQSYRVVDRMPRTLYISRTGALISSGHISKCPPELTALVSEVQEFGSGERDSPESWMYLCGLRAEIYPAYLLQSSSITLGIAAFDRSPSSTAICFFVARQDRITGSSVNDALSYSEKGAQHRSYDENSPQSEGLSAVRTVSGQLSNSEELIEPGRRIDSTADDAIDPCNTVIDDETNGDGDRMSEKAGYERNNVGRDIDVSESGDGYMYEKYNNETDNASDIGSNTLAAHYEMEYMSQTTDFVYWCLLLEPVGEGKYKRVGLAMLYPDAFEALGAEMTDVEII